MNYKTFLEIDAQAMGHLSRKKRKHKYILNRTAMTKPLPSTHSPHLLRNRVTRVPLALLAGVHTLGTHAYVPGVKTVPGSPERIGHVDRASKHVRVRPPFLGPKKPPTCSLPRVWAKKKVFLWVPTWVAMRYRAQKHVPRKEAGCDVGSTDGLSGFTGPRPSFFLCDPRWEGKHRHKDVEEMAKMRTVAACQP